MTDDTTHDDVSDSTTDRRTVLKGVGAAGATAAVGTGAASGRTALPDGAAHVDDAFDMDGGVQEALVVFDSPEATAVPAGAEGWTFESLPIAFAGLDPETIRAVATGNAVRGVYANEELEYDNDDAKALTNADATHAGTGLDASYTGESVHAAVLDSGTAGQHPDIAANLVHNWQPVGDGQGLLGEPVTWVDAAPADTDENGHGTHCSGNVAGAGTQSNGQYEGMAPDADLTMYSLGQTLLIVYVVSAFDHLVTRIENGETDVQVTSNSYSPATDGRDFDPFEPVNVATYYAFEAGVVSCFSAGNDGPGESNLSQYGEAPHTLVSPATHDGSDAPDTGFDEADRTVADFSGRGRQRNAEYAKKEFAGPNNHAREPALENVRALFDHTQPDPGRPYGVYRPDAATPGNAVMSTMSPGDALQALNPETEPWYAAISGTSMSTPILAGCVALVMDAYQQHHDDSADPVDVMNTVQATAVNYHPVDSDVSNKQGSPYTVVNAGPGFVDVQAACERAEAGDWADDVEANANLIDAETIQ